MTDFIETNLDWERGELGRVGLKLEAHQLKDASEIELLAATRDADVVIVNMARLTAPVVGGWTRCRLVVRHGIGYDNVDVEALSVRGIPLVNVPDYCVDEVAEQAIALYFALARQVVGSRRVLEQSSLVGRWSFEGVRPMHRIQGQTFGIIGFGRIGRRVYEKLAGFNFTWLICDPYVSPATRADLGIEFVELSELLRRADVVTLHTPLTSETRHLIDEHAISLMKPTAYLINTARGGLIDHGALRSALAAGRLGGAGLDVFEHEPPDLGDLLFTLPTVVMTPHLAWCSDEAGWDIRRKIVQAVLDCHGGHAPSNRVNGAAIDLCGAAACRPAAR